MQELERKRVTASWTAWAGGASSILRKHSGLCLFLLVKYSFAFQVTLALLPRGELEYFVCADPPAGAGTCLGHSRKEESAPDHTSGFTSPLASPVSRRNTWQVSLQAEISALHQVHLDCTWRGAPGLLPKADLMSILKAADMGAWEGPDTPCADVEAPTWCQHGLMDDEKHLVEAGQHS